MNCRTWTPLQASPGLPPRPNPGATQEGERAEAREGPGLVKWPGPAWVERTKEVARVLEQTSPHPKAKESGTAAAVPPGGEVTSSWPKAVGPTPSRTARSCARTSKQAGASIRRTPVARAHISVPRSLARGAESVAPRSTEQRIAIASEGAPGASGPTPLGKTTRARPTPQARKQRCGHRPGEQPLGPKPTAVTSLQSWWTSCRVPMHLWRRRSK